MEARSGHRRRGPALDGAIGAPARVRPAGRAFTSRSHRALQHPASRATGRPLDDGTILGESYAFDDANGHGARSQGVVWRDRALVRTIAPLPGSYVLAPLGASASGKIVGFSGFPSSAFVSFGGEAIDLNDLVPGSRPLKFLYQGTDVNERGQITVDGQFGCCGYLLEPK